MRLWPTLWVDDTRYINLTPWHQYQSPEIMLCDLRGGSIRIPTMGGFDQVGGAQGSFYRMAYCVNSMWFVECGYGTTDSGQKFMLWIQPTPRVSSSSPNDGSTSSSPAAVVTVPLPYAGRTHTLQFMSLNRQNLDEIIMVVQPWEARCSILLVRIDARLTHSSKSLSVISITRSNIDVEEHVESVIHIKCRSSHHHLEQTGCSSSFIVLLRERDGDGETWQIRQVEEVSGAARMLACSSRDERLGMSWLSGSKFTISHTDSSDYSVWDCENPEHTPLKEVSLPREVNGGEEKPPNGAGAGAAADTLAPQTQLESCCVIQVANQNQVVVYDALSEFLILTVVYPQWNRNRTGTSLPTVQLSLRLGCKMVSVRVQMTYLRGS
ncbi:hypothetical protein Pelo_18295 [Pelomyxa schiedti]|nr:hypothetical protein Pelo_18295 [Pelomyxa schiedti]